MISRRIAKDPKDLQTLNPQCQSLKGNMPMPNPSMPILERKYESSFGVCFMK
jgi:hypothetical protein